LSKSAAKAPSALVKKKAFDSDSTGLCDLEIGPPFVFTGGGTQIDSPREFYPTYVRWTCRAWGLICDTRELRASACLAHKEDPCAKKENPFVITYAMPRLNYTSK
jgi:hypothetical protein